MNILIIDSGTTSSRVRLFDGVQIAGSASRQAGAKDTAVHGSSEIVVRALKECIEELLERHRLSIDEIDAVVASGMITSNTGLLDVPHRQSPAGLKDISTALVSRTFPDICSKPIHFIPGVKTGFDREGAIGDKDMMRGEEAEIFGYLHEFEPAKLNDEILFMHYGSHHKCITLRQGQIEACRTSITGELMMTIMQHTILKSSLPPLAEVEPVEEWVRKGLETAEASGFGRALFSVRVADTMEKCGEQKAASFYLGALLSLDMSLLEESLTERTARLVLYGKPLYPSLFEPIVKERYPLLEVVTVSEEESDLLSAKGALRIYRSYMSGGRD